MSDDESSDEEYEASTQNKNGWAKKKRNRMLKTKVGLNLTRNFRPATREAMEANAVMSGRRVARKRKKVSQIM
jgi:hypothetical protein